MPKSPAAPAPRISVAMATYKGGAYVVEQLESLLAQTLLPAEIVVCDDASPDDTVAKIEHVAATSPVPIRLVQNPKNLRVIRNFEKAMSLCQSPYVALCDQDDVWLPTKLETTYTAIAKLEACYGATMPLLVHTELTVVDEALNPLPETFHRLDSSHRGFPWVWLPVWGRWAFKNTATGCTVMVNRALLQKALPLPPEALMHDHWLALVAAIHGYVGYVPTPTLLYRQHGHNTVGAAQRPLWQRLRTLGAKGAQFRQALSLSAQAGPV